MAQGRGRARLAPEGSLEIGNQKKNQKHYERTHDVVENKGKQFLEATM